MKNLTSLAPTDIGIIGLEMHQKLGHSHAKMFSLLFELCCCSWHLDGLEIGVAVHPSSLGSNKFVELEAAAIPNVHRLGPV